MSYISINIKTKIMETYNIIGIKIDSEKEEILEDNISCIRKAKYLLNEYQKNYGIRWKVILKIKNNPFVLKKQ
tara:strand:+ start:1188 stop:1406 length:219 start_codon:yes stop_codon:yes gene_type:complete